MELVWSLQLSAMAWIEASSSTCSRKAFERRFDLPLFIVRGHDEDHMTLRARAVRTGAYRPARAPRD